MAFYFALLNVSSAKRDDNKNHQQADSSKHQHQSRRRHSIASVESPLLDYRLLPRPQVVRNEHYFEEGLRALEESMRTQTIRPERRKQNASHATLPQGRDKDKRRETTREREKREAEERRKRKEEKAMIIPNGKAAFPHHDQQQQHQPGCSYGNHSQMQMHDGCQPGGNSGGVSSLRARQQQGRRGKGGRTLMPRRRISPQWSTTSDSRRSSKESNRSNRSERRERDSVASSNDSHATTDMSPLTSGPMKSRSANQVAEPATRLKKVTFENSPYIIANTFFGERMVLRRGSGMGAEESEEERSRDRQLDAILGDVPVKAEAYGDGLWLPSSETAPTTADAQHRQENLLNYAIQNPRNSITSRLIRRHSTSNRYSMPLQFRNHGYYSPKRNDSLCTIVSLSVLTGDENSQNANC